jgi:hypothetical protein
MEAPMAAQSSTVHPDTLDQIQSSIVDWFGSVSKGKDIPVSFSRAPKSSNRLCFVSTPAHDFKLELNAEFILLQVKSHRLSVYLDNFIVQTAFEDETLCLNIERHPRSEHRFLDSALREVAETKYPVFVSRVLRVVKSLEEDLSNARIDEATAAATDYQVILDALSASPMVNQLVSDDPFAAAKLRGLKRKQQMIEEAGGTMSTEQVSEVLGITRQAVDKRRASSQLMALTQGKRGNSYPSFQFDDGKTIKGLENVLKELKTFDPWMQLAFFASPNDRLGGKTPIRALRSGKLEEVMRAVRGYGEQGAA